jgi:hypothetical protein
MKRIPDMSYKLSDDGDWLTIEQGYDEPVTVVLHQIHMKHLADVMQLNIVGDEEGSPQLTYYLETIHEQAKNLFNYLVTVPTVPGMEEESEDVILARELLKTANQALGFWGNN